MNKKAKKNKPALIILIVLAALLVSTILVIIFGSIADNTGVSCPGLLGGTSSCVDTYLAAAMIYVPVFFLIGGVIYIIKKSYDYIEKRDSSKPKKNKK